MHIIPLLSTLILHVYMCKYTWNSLMSDGDPMCQTSFEGGLNKGMEMQMHLQATYTSAFGNIFPKVLIKKHILIPGVRGPTNGYHTY